MDIDNIVWICLLSVFVHANVYPKGTCQRRQNGSNIIYCCKNYVNTPDGCKECRDGFTSTDGITCFPCAIGRYGRRCGKNCACNYNESCDHIHGCVQNIQTLSEDRNGTFMYPLTTNQITDANDFETSTTEARNGQNVDTIDQINYLAIYIVCSSGLILCIGVLACIHRYQHKCRCTDFLLKPTKSTMECEANGNVQDIALESYESVYDIINEEHVIENFNI